MKRTAFTVAEVCVAVVLLGTLLTLSVQALGWSAAQRRELDRRSLALIEAGNAIERLTAMSWEQLTAERLDALKLSDLAQQRLPAGTLRIDLREIPRSAETPAAKQCTVEVSWKNRAGTGEAPIRVTHWFYPSFVNARP